MNSSRYCLFQESDNPLTFSRTTIRGSSSWTRLANTRSNDFRLSRSPFLNLVFLNVEKPWHGGQPTHTESSPLLRPASPKIARPVTFLRSPTIGSVPRFSL